MPDDSATPAPDGAAAAPYDHLTPHDFCATGSVLTGGRPQAFTNSISEMARSANDALSLWTNRFAVSSGELSTAALTEFENEERHYVEAFLPDCGQSAFLVFDRRLALSIVTIMLGGNGDPGPLRPLTPLEGGLLVDLADALLSRFAPELHLGSPRFRAHHHDLSTLRDGRDDAMICLGLRFLAEATGGVEAISGTMHLVLSPLSLQPFMELADRRLDGTRRYSDAITSAAAAALQPVVVSVVVGFAPVSVPTLEVAGLQPGDVLRTGQSVGRPLIASVGGAPVFTAKAGRRDERLVAELLDHLSASPQS